MLNRGEKGRRGKRMEVKDVKECVMVRRGERRALHLIFLSRAISLLRKVSLSLLGPCLLKVL